MINIKRPIIDPSEDSELTLSEYLSDKYGLDEDQKYQQKYLAKQMKSNPSNIYIITTDTYTGDQDTLLDIWTDISGSAFESSDGFDVSKMGSGYAAAGYENGLYILYLTTESIDYINKKYSRE